MGGDFGIRCTLEGGAMETTAGCVEFIFSKGFSHLLGGVLAATVKTFGVFGL